MNGKAIATGLAIAGGALGVVGGALNVYQVADQIKNGIKINKNQLDEMAKTISDNVEVTLMQTCFAIGQEVAKKTVNELRAKEETED